MSQVQDALVVGISVHRGHQPPHDAEVLVDDLGHRGQTVGGAGSVGHHVVFGWVVHVKVDTQHHRQVFVLGWRGDDDFLGPTVGDVGACAGVGVRVAKDAGGFDDDVHPQGLPGKVARVPLGKHFDAMTVHHQVAVHHFNGSGELAVVGVVFEQMRVGFCRIQVVDGHHFQLVRVIFQDGLQYLAANATETVDTDFRCHAHILLRKLGWLGSPKLSYQSFLETRGENSPRSTRGRKKFIRIVFGGLRIVLFETIMGMSVPRGCATPAAGVHLFTWLFIFDTLDAYLNAMRWRDERNGGHH